MNVGKLSVSRAVAGLMAVFFSFTFMVSHSMGLPASMKHATDQLAAKNPASHTGPGTELPYESNEKEFEDRLEESKDNLYFIYHTESLCSLFTADLRRESGLFSNHEPHAGIGVPVYLFTRTLLI
jgi:hypothetical protein